MHAAERGLGSCRAAADICGTTAKTVKRWVAPAKRTEAGSVPGGSVTTTAGDGPGYGHRGDMVVFDWGEIRPLFAFSAVAAWYRYRFVWFSDNLGVEATMEARTSAWSASAGCRRPHSPTGWDA